MSKECHIHFAELPCWVCAQETMKFILPPEMRPRRASDTEIKERLRDEIANSGDC